MLCQGTGAPLRARQLAVFASLLLPFSGLSAFSQTSTPPLSSGTPAQIAPAATAPSISTTADEVSLDLVVHTKGGKPILDLQPSEFTITDNGEPVRLSDFRLVNGAETGDHLVTMVFDHLDPGPAKVARQLAGKILSAIPDKGYYFAVLEMSGRLRVMQPFTSDRDVVNQAVAEVASGAPAPKSGDLSPAEKQLIATTQSDALLTDYGERDRARLLIAGLEESQRVLEEQHDYPSLSALLALARTQRQITGRKLVIYFSKGVYASAESRDAVRSVVGQANKAGITVVAVDTNSMDAQMGQKMMAGAAMAGAGGGAGPGGSIAGSQTVASQGFGRGGSGPAIGPGGMLDAAQNMTAMEFGGSGEEVKSPLIALASDTGGIYIQAGANWKRPVQELRDDLTTYYEANYTPEIKEYNGAFRPIEIHPLRKGIVVQTRTGYFALPPDNGSGIRPWEVPLLSLLAQPVLPTDISLETRVLRLGQLPDGNSAAIAVQVPISALQVHDDGNTHISSVHVTVVSQIRNAKGAVVERFSEDIPVHDAPDVLHSPEHQYLTMERHFSAEPGTYTLETAVMDRIGNKAGAQRIPFTIDPVAKGPALSDVALVRQIEPLHAETASFEPMRYMNGRVIPDLTNELPEKTSKLQVFFLVHPMPPASGEPHLSLEIVRNGESLGKMPLELSKNDGLGATPYLGTISGHVFPPGNYKVVATLTQGSQTATSNAEFKVEGTIADSMAPAALSFAAQGESSRAADQKATATEATSNSLFAIAASKDPVPPPTEAEQNAIIESARQRALAWGDTLPNFFCLEATNHSVDTSGMGDWRQKDTAVQVVRYVDHQESRTTLQVNGEKKAASAEDALTGEASDLDFAHSIGEFGGMFKLVFDPSAKAKFTWKEADMVDGQPAQVFDFTVNQANSQFDVAGLNNRQNVVAFHGEVYLDTATHSIRRISVDADNIPDFLAVRATSISVDYSWVTINGHDYLMPARGAVSLREGKHQAVLNEFEFRGYRRFGSSVRILSTAESKQLPKDN
ncbi:MAG TPA: VWA domain-containing protein [Acidobacteriaceae bacterium]|nr:VWA domain-containing protein [Acidobacteriaceae bacterium]